MKAHIYYHRTDFDGQAAGAIARHYYEGLDIEVVMHPSDYVDDINVPDPGPDEAIACVDFSFDVATTRRLADSGRFVWIDHHKTAIEKIEKADPPIEFIKGSRKDGTAACVLCWKYFFPERDVPAYIWLLGKYDVWDQSDMSAWENSMLPLQSGMRQTTWRPNIEEDYARWRSLFTVPEVNAEAVMVEFIRQGRSILKYVRQQDAVAAKAGCYEATIDGHPAIVINKGGTNSEFFKSVKDPAKHEVMAAWSYNGKKFRVTLYAVNPEFDVSEIAKKFGGGGHKGAAGFEWTGDIREVIET